ncbi:MAG: prepilin-type N-terminal cleavage/methylation domain-containing protein [Candidatus Didemnitutus sp.]|nr:prepilin-type N-terminal cleavage/methylation domain-containing protein [Candidatus Didemnitutus sp.]
MKRRPSIFRVRSTGFTLLELLAVIAVIGILAALIFPSVGAARKSANRTKTKVQFNQWATAIEGFRSEYGYYPVFHAENLVNPPAQTSTAGAVHLFHDLLAGRRRSGEALPAYSASSNVQLPEVQNRKRIVFHSFSASDLTDDTSPAPNLVRDAFDNVSIAVLVDRNLDGVINATDYPVYPAVVTREGGSIRPGPAQIPAPGVRAGVIFYAPDPNATAANPEFILSWK